jgi:hypothetical protein
MTQVVEYLPSKCKALSSNQITFKNNIVIIITMGIAFMLGKVVVFCGWVVVVVAQQYAYT